MKKLRLVGSISFFIIATLSCNVVQSTTLQADDVPANQALLNEILFLPASGQPAFVELKSIGNQTSLAGMVLTNEQGVSYPIPPSVASLNVDQYLIIIFDGINSVDGVTVHADRTEFLNPKSGFLELYSTQSVLVDRIAWGEDQAGAVKLSRGGIIFDIEPGLTIGRSPLSTLTHPLEWTVFYPDLATPGRANPQPAVDVMIPLNGAVIKQLAFELSWYPVLGAVEYRVQVSSDDSFGNFIVDEITREPVLEVEIQAGKYFWRVQAITETGGLAEFSPVQYLTINPQFSMAHLAKMLQQTTLGVPFLSQHKDTSMLLLESKNETGGHAWDIDHQALDRSDPADNTNCALASIAMINRYLGGDLSQDRIGFEIFKDRWDGPEYDLNFGDGFYFTQTTEALTFALDVAPEFRPEPETLDVLWADVQWEIDAGRPILAAIRPGHALVITGYYEDNSTRYVMINDPWWGEYAADIAGVRWKYYWLISPNSIPILNDPEIGMDSDGDGIVDFDEINRFGTDPDDRDTDQDNLEDKADLRASIYDEQWGYALASLSFLGRDYDNDGVKMELDEDSDGGGCFDGMEDIDKDGKYKEPETWNFDEKDDACFWGTEELVRDGTTVYEDGSSYHQRIRHFAKYSVHVVEGGNLEGVARVSFSHTGEHVELGSPPCTGTSILVGGETHWQVDLSGDYQKLQDGSTLVSFNATPERGPAYTTEWVGPCVGEPSNEEGWAWPGLSGTIKDGLFDYYNDLSSLFIDETGEWWQKIHMEQGVGIE